MWLLLFPGCATIAHYTLPSGGVSGVDVERVDFVGVGLTIGLDVHNPYPVDVTVTRASWVLRIAGEPLMGGIEAGEMPLPAMGDGQVRVPVAVAFANLFDAVKSLATESEIPYAFEAQVTLATGMGDLTVPLAHSGTLPVLRAPSIDWRALRLDAFDLYAQVAKVALVLDVIPAPQSPITLEGLDYGLTFERVPVASGRATLAPTPGSTELTLPLDLNLLWASQSIVGSLVAGTPLTAELRASAAFGTPFGTVPLEFVRSITFNGG